MIRNTTIVKRIKYHKVRKVQPNYFEYTGEHTTDPVEMQLFVFDEEGYEEYRNVSLDRVISECKDELQADDIKWLNVHGLHDVELIKKIGELFEVEPFIIGDILNTSRRTRIEELGNVLFFSVKSVLPEEEDKSVKTEQVSFLLKDNVIVSFQEKKSDYFTHIRERIRTGAGKKYGLPAKIHVNQFTAIKGIAACVKHNALSVDHLEIVTDDDIEALKGTDTMPVALPTCSFFISIPYTPARKMLEAGLPLALATDFNPGTTPSGNMNLVVATACIKMKMTPEEAINAATINGAYAMGLNETHGSVTKGKSANLIITKPLNSYYQLPYAFGSNLIDTVLIEGKVI